MSAKIRRNQ